MNLNELEEIIKELKETEVCNLTSETDIVNEFQLDSLDIFMFVDMVEDVSGVDITDDPDFYQKLSSCAEFIKMIDELKERKN